LFALFFFAGGSVASVSSAVTSPSAYSDRPIGRIVPPESSDPPAFVAPPRWSAQLPLTFNGSP
jgi:hypothetical protein